MSMRHRFDSQQASHLQITLRMLGDVDHRGGCFFQRHGFGQERRDIDLLFGDETQAFRELADAVA